MKIKAVGFDVGHTLIHYNNPLNWQSLYEPALRKVFEECGMAYSGEKIKNGEAILTKYNTRVNYRETEVKADTIFGELLGEWGMEGSMLYRAKSAFYSFFQAEAVPYPDTLELLAELKREGIRIGILTDVAYGMDNEFSLKDISGLMDYVDVCLTSVDVGFRKPHEAGFRQLMSDLDAAPDEMLFVGDEEKDIKGANQIGMGSVLIDRSHAPKLFGQRYSISQLIHLLQHLE